MVMKALPVMPYAGLKPFSEEDAPFFFGREKVRENIIANLKAKRLTIVFGASGVGKSSVLRAGVAYKLRRLAQENLDEKGKPEFAVVVFSEWAGNPFAGLTESVREAVREALDEQELEPAQEPGSLADTLRFRAEQVGGNLLVILDQFEEYFLYHGYEDGESSFAHELVRIINRSDLRVNFLIAIRDDAFSKIKRFSENTFFDNLMEIDHLDRDAAGAAIKNPVDQYNRFYAAGRQQITVEPELVEEILTEVRAGRLSLSESVDGSGTNKGGATRTKARIETPFLQLVMTELWKEEILSGSTALRLATLNRLGGADKIVTTHLTQVMNNLSKSEQEVAARIFRNLVTPSRSKIAMSAADLAELEEKDQVQVVELLEKLSKGSHRILRAFASPGADGEPRYEIFHDVLAQAVLDWRRTYVETRRAEDEKQRAMERVRAEEKTRAAKRHRVLLILIAGLVVLTLATTIFAWIKAERAAVEEGKLNNEKMRQLASQKTNTAGRTLADVFKIVIEQGEPERAGEHLQSITDKLNEKLESYRRDDNKIGEGMTLNNLAGISRLWGDSYGSSGHYQDAQSYYRQAKAHYKQARTLLENALWPDHIEVVISINDLAYVYVQQGKYAKAERLFEQSLDVLQKVLGPEDLFLADSLRNVAECYYIRGKYDEAEALYNRVWEIRRNGLPENHSKIAESLNDLAWLYYAKGRYAQAEPLFKQSLAMWRNKQLNPYLSLNGLGAIYRIRGRYDEADEYLKEAMRLQGGLQGEDQQANAEVLQNFGMLYTDWDKSKAGPLLEESLGLWIKNLGEHHPITAICQGELARFYYRAGKFDKAKTNFEKALQIQEAAVRHSPELALTSSGLARLYTDSGDYKEAERLFLRALAIQEKSIPGHPDIAETLNNYAALLLKTKRAAEAAQMQQRAKQISDKHKMENPDN